MSARKKKASISRVILIVISVLLLLSMILGFVLMLIPPAQ